ncbi:pkgB [Symbiodinium natans]|uniref:PkgB protein n=1 Tax=Symbiodinium natans TaxID=878477 RepID=A0A812J9F7_9DINO|nr:pkgB [Symbiodinium natans]
MTGSTCLRLDMAVLQNFVAVHGGRGKSCRGQHASDKKDAYYIAITADSVDECKAACVQHVDCQGINFLSTGHCEVWTRPEGIEATAEDDNSVCLKAPMRNSSSCWKHHGADEFETDPLLGQYSLQECQEACLKEPECQGIVMPQGNQHVSKKTCWLRKNVHKEHCRQDHPFNFWLRPGVELQQAGPTSEAACCAAYDSWPEKDNVQCSGCTALINAAPFGGRCDKYCESFGHVCYQAAEEVNENCCLAARTCTSRV